MKKVIIVIIVCLIIIALICSTVCLGFIVRNDKAKIAKLENEIAILKENNINHDLKDEEGSGENSEENAIENAAGIYERTDGYFGKLTISFIEEKSMDFDLECYYKPEGENEPSIGNISGEAIYDNGKFIYNEEDFKLIINVSKQFITIEEAGEYPHTGHNVSFAGEYKKVGGQTGFLSWEDVFKYNGKTVYDGLVQRHTIDASINYLKSQLNGNIFGSIIMGDYAICFEEYLIGDGTRSYEIVSNYKQYETINDVDEKIQKYENPIEMKAAIFDGNFLHGYNGAVEDLDIEEITKYQADVFEDVMEKGHWQNKIKLEDCYYKPTGILFMNGNNRSEEDYYNNARAKSLKLYVDGNFVTDVYLNDSFDIQLIDLEGYDLVHNDISVPVNITMEVTEYYEGKKSNDIYISDIQIGMKSNLPGGI